MTVLGGEGSGKGQRVFREREAEGSGAIVDGTEQINSVFIGHVNSQENESQRGSIVTSAANRRREVRAADNNNNVCTLCHLVWNNTSTTVLFIV